MTCVNLLPNLTLWKYLSQTKPLGNMKNIVPIVKITFDHKITTSEIPSFRNSLHNALKLHYPAFQLSLVNKTYQYPFIQLKTNYNNGILQPMLVGIGAVAKTLSKILEQGDFLPMKLGGGLKKIKIEYIKVSYLNWQASQETKKYRIFNYQAFNQRRYQDFQRIASSQGFLSLIREALEGHIQTLYKAIGTTGLIPQIEDVKILKSSTQAIGNTRFLCFNLEFVGNVFLPEHIGLGNAVGRGFGTIRRPRKTLSRNLQAPSDIKGRPQNITQISS